MTICLFLAIGLNCFVVIGLCQATSGIKLNKECGDHQSGTDVAAYGSIKTKAYFLFFCLFCLEPLLSNSKTTMAGS